MAIDCPHSWYRRPQHVDRGAPEADGPPPQPQAADASGSPRTSRGYPPAAVPAADTAESHESSAPSIAPNSLLDSQGLFVPGIKIFESSAVGDLFNLSASSEVPPDPASAEPDVDITSSSESKLESDSTMEEYDSTIDDLPSPDSFEHAAEQSDDFNLPLASAFKKKQKIKKRVGDRLIAWSRSVDSATPVQKATRPVLVTSRKKK